MKIRKSARALLLNNKNQIFLTKIQDENLIDPKNQTRKDSYWITVGGSLEIGETEIDALKRELYEETGIRRTNIIEPPAWHEKVMLNFHGNNVIFSQNFYVTYVDADKISLENLTDYEINVLQDYKWWADDELKKSKEQFFPDGFIELIIPIMKGNIPSETIEITEDRIKNLYR